MSRQLKKMAAATILAFGLPASAYALQGVNFDPDGLGIAGGLIVKTFDWGPAHVLYSNCFGLGGLGATDCTIYAQGSISALKSPGDANLAIPAGVTYTFTLVTKATSSDPGGTYTGAGPAFNTLLFSDAADATSLFTIYKDTTPGAGDPNALAGTGYDNGSVILTGRVSVVSYALSNTGTATENLDQSGINNWGTLKTHATSGSPKFHINVLTKNDDYFTDPIALFSLQLEDADQNDNSGSPFSTVDPSKIIAGKGFAAADTGTDGVNDIFCGAGKLLKCSGEFQGDASTTFLTQVVPEPGVLALLGMGLAGMGAFVRRRKGSRVA